MRRPSAVVLVLVAFTSSTLVAQADKPVPLAELEAAARRDSLDAETLYRLALRYDLIDRYDDAERAAREAVSIDPHCARAWLLLSYLPFDRRPSPTGWSAARSSSIPSWISACRARRRRSRTSWPSPTTGSTRRRICWYSA